MSRIKIDDTIMDIFTKMSEGNPGALSALMMVYNDGEKIDPQAFMGGLGNIMLLDTFEIYGTDIYILFNDKCNRDVRKLIVLLRATQLGLFPQTRLRRMAGDQARMVNFEPHEFEELDGRVCAELEEFQKPAKERVTL